MSREQLDRLIASLRAKEAFRPESVAEMRAEIARNMAKVPAAPGVRRRDVEAAGLRAAWFDPSAATGEHAILYFHGGGYALGSIDTHDSLTSRMAEAAGASCLSVEYRLAPEHRYPAALEDGLAAYRWMLEHAAPAERLAIAGDSAGGGLALATLVAARDAGLPLPACAVCLSPWADLACEGESIEARKKIDPTVSPGILRRLAHIYLGHDDPRHPLASPLYANLSGLPPLLVQVGTAEVLFDDSARLAERARAQGVDVHLEVWDDMFHVWQLFAPLLDEAQAAIDAIGRFIRLHWSY
ncbi:MAG: alpha/beta hydrolase fold domain-containing protein [Candidatus Hydrogenedens sp.]|nr:alpha/beta hydrolase fold domain-containing protein [Candidatus Hydrogenedens sp.]